MAGYQHQDKLEDAKKTMVLDDVFGAIHFVVQREPDSGVETVSWLLEHFFPMSNRAFRVRFVDPRGRRFFDHFDQKQVKAGGGIAVVAIATEYFNEFLTWLGGDLFLTLHKEGVQMHLHVPLQGGIKRARCIDTLVALRSANTLPQDIMVWFNRTHPIELGSERFSHLHMDKRPQVSAVIEVPSFPEAFNRLRKSVGARMAHLMEVTPGAGFSIDECICAYRIAEFYNGPLSQVFNLRKRHLSFSYVFPRDHLEELGVASIAEKLHFDLRDPQLFPAVIAAQLTLQDVRRLFALHNKPPNFGERSYQRSFEGFQDVVDRRFSELRSDYERDNAYVREQVGERLLAVEKFLVLMTWILCVAFLAYGGIIVWLFV